MFQTQIIRIAPLIRIASTIPISVLLPNEKSYSNEIWKVSIILIQLIDEVSKFSISGIYFLSFQIKKSVWFWLLIWENYLKNRMKLRFLNWLLIKWYILSLIIVWRSKSFLLLLPLPLPQPPHPHQWLLVQLTKKYVSSFQAPRKIRTLKFFHLVNCIKSYW